MFLGSVGISLNKMFVLESQIKNPSSSQKKNIRRLKSAKTPLEQGLTSVNRKNPWNFQTPRQKKRCHPAQSRITSTKNTTENQPNKKTRKQRFWLSLEKLRLKNAFTCWSVYIYTYIYIFLFTCLNRNIYRHIKLFINTYLKTSLPTTRSTKFILSSCLLLIPKKNTPTSRLGVFHRGDGLP